MGQNSKRKRARKQKNYSRSPEDEEDEEEEEEEEEGGLIRCICGKNVDQGLMIECEKCLVWQHGSCFGLKSDNVPENWFCELCRGQKRNIEDIKVPKFEFMKNKETLETLKNDFISLNINLVESEKEKVFTDTGQEVLEKYFLQLINNNVNERNFINITSTLLCVKKDKILEYTNTLFKELEKLSDEYKLSSAQCNIYAGWNPTTANKYSKHFLQTHNSITDDNSHTCNDKSCECANLKEISAIGSNFYVDAKNKKTSVYSQSSFRKDQTLFEIFGKVHNLAIFQVTIFNCFILYQIGALINPQKTQREREKWLFCHDIPFTFYFSGKKISLDCRKYANIYRYLSFSCNPNADVKILELHKKIRVCVYATKDIKSGEEITIPFHFPGLNLKSTAPCSCSSLKPCQLTKWYNTRIMKLSNCMKKLKDLLSSPSIDNLSNDGDTSIPTKSPKDKILASLSCDVAFDSKDSKLSREERKIQQYMKTFEKLETRKKSVGGSSVAGTANTNTPKKLLSPKRKVSSKPSSSKKKIEIEDNQDDDEVNESSDSKSSHEDRISNGSREKFSPETHKSTPSKRLRIKNEGEGEENLPNKIMKPSLDQYHFLSQLKVHEPLEKLEDEIEAIGELLSYKPSISISKLGKKRYFLYCYQKDQKLLVKKDDAISPKSMILSRYLKSHPEAIGNDVNSNTTSEIQSIEQEGENAQNIIIQPNIEKSVSTENTVTTIKLENTEDLDKQSELNNNNNDSRTSIPIKTEATSSPPSSIASSIDSKSNTPGRIQIEEIKPPSLDSDPKPKPLSQIGSPSFQSVPGNAGNGNINNNNNSNGNSSSKFPMSMNQGPRSGNGTQFGRINSPVNNMSQPNNPIHMRYSSGQLDRRMERRSGYSPNSYAPTLSTVNKTPVNPVNSLHAPSSPVTPLYPVYNNSNANTAGDKMDEKEYPYDHEEGRSESGEKRRGGWDDRGMYSRRSDRGFDRPMSDRFPDRQDRERSHHSSDPTISPRFTRSNSDEHSEGDNMEIDDVDDNTGQSNSNILFVNRKPHNSPRSGFQSPSTGPVDKKHPSLKQPDTTDRSVPIGSSGGEKSQLFQPNTIQPPPNFPPSSRNNYHSSIPSSGSSSGSQRGPSGWGHRGNARRDDHRRMFEKNSYKNRR